PSRHPVSQRASRLAHPVRDVTDNRVIHRRCTSPTPVRWSAHSPPHTNRVAPDGDERYVWGEGQRPRPHDLSKPCETGRGLSRRVFGAAALLHSGDRVAALTDAAGSGVG